jgi:Ser/Thr protein kinase RdoA (MazF antagonist)
MPGTTAIPAPGVWRVLARYLDRDLARAATVSEIAAAGTCSALLVGLPAPCLVLRRLPAGTTAARARFVTAVHHHAACAGCAPPLLANDEGERLTLNGGRYFQLVRYVENTWDPHVVPGPHASAGLGLALGRLHSVLAGLSAPVAGQRLAFPADPGAALRAAYAAHDHGACAHPTARRALAAKLRRAEALSQTVLETLARLPQRVIHGDVHPGNVLASRSTRAAGTRALSLIDFDRTRYAPPAYEVMRALIYCVRPSGPRWAFEDRAGAFLGGYLSANPLSSREIETMAVLYETVQVLGTFGLGACHGASAAAVAFGEARFSLLYWLRRHGSAVVELARQPTPPTAG